MAKSTSSDPALDGRPYRLRSGSTALAMMCAAIALPPAPVSADTEAATTEVTRQDPAWGFACDRAQDGSEVNCQISQSVTVRETGQRVVSVVVQKNGQTGGIHLLLALPHKIYLPSGVDLSVDEGDPFGTQVETCDERACYATLEISGAFVLHMMTGGALNITFQNLLQKPVTLPIPLGGFESAFQRLP